MDENLNISQMDENANIEVEEIGVERITVPFDPNLIRIRRDPFILGELIDKIEYDEINFQTSFQRESDLWDAGKQSRLIESVLLRLPLPAFYFDEIIEEHTKFGQQKLIWQVIDGLQRCSAFNNFIVNKTLKLEGLEFLSQFDGCSYSDLPRELQRRITQTPITVYIVEKGTPDEVKFNIFKRINTGGLILTSQEIRHAMNQGIPAEYVSYLAQMQSFKMATCGIIPTYRMEDRDFITRFVSFFLQDYRDYQPDLDSFLTRGMSLIKKTTELERTVMAEKFDKAMHLAHDIFGDDAFRKRLNIDDRRKPLNKALFEVISVLFSQLADKDSESLLQYKDIFKRKFIELNNDDTFRYSISSGTGKKDSVTRRYKEMSRIITETLNSHD